MVKSYKNTKTSNEIVKYFAYLSSLLNIIDKFNLFHQQNIISDMDNLFLYLSDNIIVGNHKCFTFKDETHYYIYKDNLLKYKLENKTKYN